MDFVLLDTETDGLQKPIHILELAGIIIRNGRPTGEKFQMFLNHKIYISQEATAIHGYTREFLNRNGHNPRDVHHEFEKFRQGLPLCAHNLAFDYNRCLDPERQRLMPRGTQIPQRGFCTVMLLRRCFPHISSFNLQSLARILEIKLLPGEKDHCAATDTRITGEIWSQEIFPILHETGIQNFSQLLEISQRSPVQDAAQYLRRNAPQAWTKSKLAQLEEMVNYTETTKEFKPNNNFQNSREVTPRQKMVLAFWDAPYKSTYTKKAITNWIDELYQRRPLAKKAWEQFKKDYPEINSQNNPKLIKPLGKSYYEKLI